MFYDFQIITYTCRFESAFYKTFYGKIVFMLLILLKT